MSDIVSPTGSPTAPLESLPAASVPTWQEQDATLREMWMQNKTPQEISDTLGRSVSAIMTRAARLGLPRRAAPGRKSNRHLLSEGLNGVIREQRRPAPRSAPVAEAAAQTSPRVCLMCLTTFQSLGRHNRICSSCKNSSEYASASTLSDIHITST